MVTNGVCVAVSAPLVLLEGKFGIKPGGEVPVGIPVPEGIGVPIPIGCGVPMPETGCGVPWECGWGVPAYGCGVPEYGWGVPCEWG